VEPTSHYIQVRDFFMHYSDWGDNGPALVLLHGIQRGGRSWDPVARRLADRFHVIVPDGRGHGDSEWTWRGYKTEDRKLDFLAFVDALGLHNIRVAGHSYGAMVAVFSALDRPDMFHSLYLQEIIHTMTAESRKGWVKSEYQRKRYWASRTALDEYLHWHRDTQKWPEEVIQTVLQHEVLQHPNGQVESKWAPQTFNEEEGLTDFYSLPPLFHKLAMPTALLMAGSRKPEELATLRAEMLKAPRGQFSVIEGAGHNVYLDFPEFTARTILEFLDGRPFPERVAAQPVAPGA